MLIVHVDVEQVFQHKMKKTLDKIKKITSQSDYKYGFVTDIKEDRIPNGLNKNTIRKISHIKKEPNWLLNWRLKAYDRWLKMKEPNWSNLKYPKINYNDICYTFY